MNANDFYLSLITASGSELRISTMLRLSLARGSTHLVLPNGNKISKNNPPETRAQT